MRFLENMVSDLVKQSTGINAKRVIRKIGGKNILLAGGAAVLAGTLAQKSQGQGGMGGLMGSLTGGQGVGGGQVGGMPPQGQNHAPPPPVPGQAPPPPIPGQAPPPPIPGQAVAPPPVPQPQAVPQSTSPQIPQQAPPPIPGAGAPAAPPVKSNDGEAAMDPEVTYAVIRTMVAAALSDGHMAPEEKTSIQGRLAESGLDEVKTRQIHQDLVLPPSPAELAKMTANPELRETLYRFAALVVVTDDKVDDLERRWLDRLSHAFEIPAERKAALEAETLGAMQGNG